MHSNSLNDHPALSPAQLYHTESGQLFHAGKIAIVLVGLPARGKTHLAVSLGRYLTWLGVTCKAFHLGDYRRTRLTGEEMPPDYFFSQGTDSQTSSKTKALRDAVAADCMSDIFAFYADKGQVAIFDAVNPTEQIRRDRHRAFSEHGVQTLFVESVCTDTQIIEANVRGVKVTSPDYAGWDQERAVADYMSRISAKIPHYEEMSREREGDLSWVKMINIGERMVVNKGNFGYLPSRIVFFLMNLHVKPRVVYFARAGKAAEASFKSDSPLGEEGRAYAAALCDTLCKRRAEERQQAISKGLAPEERKLTVWTSPRLRTVMTANDLRAMGCTVRRRPQLTALNPGVYDTMTLDEIRARYPGEAEKHEANPWIHRFPRAESYHDVAIRLEPVLLEMERERDDLLIIAHESILRVLYGYFMGLDSMVSHLDVCIAC